MDKQGTRKLFHLDKLIDEFNSEIIKMYIHGGNWSQYEINNVYGVEIVDYKSKKIGFEMFESKENQLFFYHNNLNRNLRKGGQGLSKVTKVMCKLWGYEYDKIYNQNDGNYNNLKDFEFWFSGHNKHYNKKFIEFDGWTSSFYSYDIP
tara:strand:+ start:34 stop:477 length:444 start_codon:yes stop_codon:yes gene_type:complete